MDERARYGFDRLSEPAYERPADESRLRRFWRERRCAHPIARQVQIGRPVMTGRRYPGWGSEGLVRTCCRDCGAERTTPIGLIASNEVAPPRLASLSAVGQQSLTAYLAGGAPARPEGGEARR